VISLDGAGLTCPQIVSLARRRDEFRLAPSGRAAAERSHTHARRVAEQRPLYGRSTGVGAKRMVTVADSGTHVASLLRSHATTSGPDRIAERVRAMLAVRLNQLAAGGSGASPELLDALAAMLAADALPLVREYGSLGTGDLSALAVTGLALLGEAPTTRPLPAELTLGPHDALPLISSNAATIGDAALAVVELTTLARAAMEVAALTFDAVEANPEAFSSAVERATPFDGARVVCETMRALIARGSTQGRTPARIQDPFGLRTLPQVHGAFLDALCRLEEVTERYANAPSENPLLLPDHEVAHHGGFHIAYLAQAVEAAVSAAAQSAHLAFARLTMLGNPAYTGMSPYLSDGPAGSGTMMCEYVAASALASLRALGLPVSTQTVTLSHGTEDDASFAALAAQRALDVVAAYRTVLACELVVAVRALRLRGAVLPKPFGQLPDAWADRDLTPDLDLAAELLGGQTTDAPSGTQTSGGTVLP
jgi:histidine ammonia-lyase